MGLWSFLPNSLPNLQLIEARDHDGTDQHRNRECSASGQYAAKRQILENREPRIDKKELLTQPHQHDSDPSVDVSQPTVFSNAAPRDAFTQIT